MKHILNNISEEEKNAIREQHTGGMKLNTEKFKNLIETKQGDVKPLVSEQSYSPLGDVTTGSSHKAVKAVFDSCRNVPQSPININKLVDGVCKMNKEFIFKGQKGDNYVTKFNGNTNEIITTKQYDYAW